MGLTRKDLEKVLGSRARVSEILNRKRTLSLAMIRDLHKGLGIPADVLIGVRDKSGRRKVAHR
jgi:HTH-type transcriptional regulator/antitoxin HigA